MSGFYGAISKQDCVYDVFYGTDYHSHLGSGPEWSSITKRKDSVEPSIALRMDISEVSSNQTWKNSAGTWAWGLSAIQTHNPFCSTHIWADLP